MTDPIVAIDRVWSIRDAILAWLYIKAMVQGNRHPVLKPDDIAATVDWRGAPLTEPEVAAASDWLKGEGYISGSSAWGHGVIRPSITPRGERMADQKLSVRPGGETPADPQGVTTIHIRNSTNVAIGSPGATQTYNVSEQIEKCLAVADLLASASEGDAGDVERAHQVAADIKAEAAANAPESGKLKKLVLSALGIGMTTLAHDGAAELVHLGSQALGTF
ncbi:hypothetical protein [Mycolicibacterium porcinum]|uniref:ESX-1 secretion-associated protein EspA/EspE-like domain-containing protein n=1 Tax=Mycolicibacterium porcinum TaxID=39693 RepID=A0AAW5TCB9_9MYCO|nr:hypothetical protein [Mycolicibacterium porcinum]MCV7391933.1 hypothetical protein [Mycolicibacterium porcinum]ORB34348.1 hypothetical protein BST41_31270 [Mycolicibacterium porcinum]CDO33313.1 hypothetical protein BN979_06160 [Mycolicibacterium vulneris]